MDSLDKIYYDDLTWPEINDAVELGKVCIVPCGAVEQHGPHLPLDVDLICPTEIARGAGRQAPDKGGRCLRGVPPFRVSPRPPERSAIRYHESIRRVSTRIRPKKAIHGNRRFRFSSSCARSRSFSARKLSFSSR